MPHSAIHLGTVVRACPGHLMAKVQNETVVLQVASGQYFGLNEIGTRIWNLIQSPTALSGLIDELMLDYDVAPGELEADVISLLEELRAAQLAEVCDHA